MKQLRAHNLSFLIVTTVGLCTLWGAFAIDGSSPVAPWSSSDGSEKCVEADDVDDVDDSAIAGHGCSIALGVFLRFQLESPQDSPLLAHGYRWCSRGPPLA